MRDSVPAEAHLSRAVGVDIVFSRKDRYRPEASRLSCLGNDMILEVLPIWVTFSGAASGGATTATP